ncbi:hypothetical protein F4780DRAFT_608844 [Xylariomycetidae sp. FL0641]|nr:hypothetical protein F4780DRAFT_608844 [Xylariomycetidae sp. FL0641]
MPFKCADAPPWIPAQETIEALLERANEDKCTGSRKKSSRTPALSQLRSCQRRSTGLVSLGSRCDTIPGDPYGILASGAGNVSHLDDPRMVRHSLTVYTKPARVCAPFHRYHPG